MPQSQKKALRHFFNIISMDYVELKCMIDSKEPKLAADILIAELNEYGFESYEIKNNTLYAYIPSNKFSSKLHDEIKSFNHILINKLTIESKIIRSKNWNQLWESNFEPIEINNECIIKASFHKNTPEKKYEIIINPKMSFGTGHHETTFLMLSEISNLNLENKNILDIGCGTGILSILAAKMNAKKITAIDIDPKSIENVIENSKINNCQNIEIISGDSNVIPKQKYDIILANINLNVILQNINIYADRLESKGKLLISGIYNEDINSINEKAITLTLNLLKKNTRNSWAFCLFEKNTYC